MSADDTSTDVYNKTTEPSTTRERRGIPCLTIERVGHSRFFTKCATVLFSFVAFVLEEIVPECVSCAGLYFFEFVSCSAFLLSLCLLVMLCTPLFNRLNIGNWKLVDFFSISLIGVFFLFASVVYAATHNDTDLEKASIAFGFIATVAFGVDVALSLKHTKPFEKKDGSKKATSQSSNTKTAEGETDPLSGPTS